MWKPKLDKAAPDAAAHCRGRAGTDRCALDLGKIMNTVWDLEPEITWRHAEARYPRTLKQIRTMTKASRGYTGSSAADDCQGDPAANAPESECEGYALAIATGAGLLGYFLHADETIAAAGG